VYQGVDFQTQRYNFANLKETVYAEKTTLLTQTTLQNDALDNRFKIFIGSSPGANPISFEGYIANPIFISNQIFVAPRDSIAVVFNEI
jgi:hypothetical protein